MIAVLIVVAYIVVALLTARHDIAEMRNEEFREWEKGVRNFAQRPEYEEKPFSVRDVTFTLAMSCLWPLMLAYAGLSWFLLSKKTAHDHDITARKRDEELAAREAEVARKEREIEEWHR